jgi:hypothetical protein
MYKVSLYFNEDFLDFDVYINGFETEAEAEEFAILSDSCLYLRRTGLELVVGKERYLIARENVVVRIDRQWHTRTPLDPSSPEFPAKIKQSMSDYEQGIDNPFNVKEEDLEIVDFSFDKLFDLLTRDRLDLQELKIAECIAYGVHPSRMEDTEFKELIQRAIETGETANLKVEFWKRIDSLCTPEQAQKIRDEYNLFEQDVENCFFTLIEEISK